MSPSPSSARLRLPSESGRPSSVEEVIARSLGSATRGWHGDQRRIQRERFVDDVALGPVSWMREKAVGEGMAAFVGARVRVERAA